MSGISTFQNIYFYSREAINNEVPQNEKKTLMGLIPECPMMMMRMVSQRGEMWMVTIVLIFTTHPTRSKKIRTTTIKAGHSL